MEFLSKYDPVLKEHLPRTKMSEKRAVSYLQPQIQHEFIIVLGENVKRSIVDQVKQAKYLAIIFDSTPDLSHNDKPIEMTRYILIKGSSVK